MEIRSTLTALAVLISCAACGGGKIDRTSVLGEYLSSEFNEAIPAQSHLYVTVPSTGCQGAMARMLSAFDSTFTPSCPVTLISANPDVVSSFFKRDWRILHDRSGKLDKLNLGITNVSLIRTDQHTITQVLSSAECDSLRIGEFRNAVNHCGK